MADRCIQAYLSSQLQTFVAIVISVIHLVVPLSQDDTPHHHSQVNTFSPKVKLLHLQKKAKMIKTTGIYNVNHQLLSAAYRNVGKDKRCQEFSGLLHLGFLGASPHALSSDFIPKVSQGLK